MLSPRDRDRLKVLHEAGSGHLTPAQGGTKGRIARFFGTAQDRLVKGMRQAVATGNSKADASPEWTESGRAAGSLYPSPDLYLAEDLRAPGVSGGREVSR